MSTTLRTRLANPVVEALTRALDTLAEGTPEWDRVKDVRDTYTEPDWPAHISSMVPEDRCSWAAERGSDDGYAMRDPLYTPYDHSDEAAAYRDAWLAAVTDRAYEALRCA